MKRVILFTTAILLLAATACTEEPFETRTPIRFTVDVDGFENDTRVTDNGTSFVWNEGDTIKVKIDNYSAETFRVTAEGLATPKLGAGSIYNYWSDDNVHTIKAWYPAVEGPIDIPLDAQSTNGLVYLLSATQTDVGSYSENIPLTFHHQLAKVRIVIGNILPPVVTSVELFTYQIVTWGNGEITAKKNLGYIQAKKTQDNVYEATIAPGMAIDHFIRVTDASGFYYFPYSPVELKAGTNNTFTIND